MAETTNPSAPSRGATGPDAAGTLPGHPPASGGLHADAPAPHPSAATADGGEAATRRDPPEQVRPQDSGSERTWTVLIAALGGQGGGVLSNWLVDAAAADGRQVQATSVPGVAQRTGATTYYLEIGPHTAGGGNGAHAGGGTAHGGNGNSRDGAALAESGAAHGEDPAGRGSGGERRVMALLPTPGNVDLLVASELLEAGRAAWNGMITPDRTTVIASTHRMFAIAEKSAMGDGRFEDDRIRSAVRELSRRHLLADLGKTAQEAGTVLSSVLLGAVAGSGALPIPPERLRAAIERAGIAVEANLRGFDAGRALFDAADANGAADAMDGEAGNGASAGRPAPFPVSVGRTAGSAPSSDAAPPSLPPSLAARVDALPAAVHEVARLGVERAVDYQDERYGAQYLDRLDRLLAATRDAGGKSRTGGGADGHPAAGTSAEAGEGGGLDSGAAVSGGDAQHAAVREAARQLALWMCFEDIVRVADLKTRRSRIERVRAEVRAQPGQPVVITEFLKPGVDEWCSLLPSALARRILAAADRGGWRRRLNVGLHVRTSSVAGFVLLWTLARLKGLRRRMHRFREEQERIERWLAAVAEALGTGDPAFALEAAQCAGLVKGYGETHERGVRNFERTMACLGACARAPDPAASLRALREAALADPEGTALDTAVQTLTTPTPAADALRAQHS